MESCDMGGRVVFITGQGIYEWDGSAELPKPVDLCSKMNWEDFEVHGPEHDTIIENL